MIFLFCSTVVALSLAEIKDLVSYLLVFINAGLELDCREVEARAGESTMELTINDSDKGGGNSR